MILAVAARPWLFSARIDLLAFTLPAVCALALVALVLERGYASRCCARASIASGSAPTSTSTIKRRTFIGTSLPAIPKR